MVRIEMNDNKTSVLHKMSGGNPGALNVLLQILSKGEKIDPQGAMGGLGMILLFDTFKIYDERIWMLYQDVCNQDLINMLACVRACQLGIISESTLHHAIDNRGNGINPDSLLKKVQKQVPDFGHKPETN